MKRGLTALIILFVFTFGLIPGEYWRLLHPHEHGKPVHTKGVTISYPQKICPSKTHLFDYTKVVPIYVTVQVQLIQTINVSLEIHLPHPSFLNISLRAPPAYSF